MSLFIRAVTDGWGSRVLSTLGFCTHDPPLQDQTRYSTSTLRSLPHCPPHSTRRGYSQLPLHSCIAHESEKDLGAHGPSGTKAQIAFCSERPTGAEIDQARIKNSLCDPPGPRQYTRYCTRFNLLLRAHERPEGEGTGSVTDSALLECPITSAEAWIPSRRMGACSGESLISDFVPCHHKDLYQ